MGLTRAPGTLVLVVILLALAVLVPPPAHAGEPADITILFDLGDGTYRWSRVHMPDRLATNASWQATLSGAAIHDLVVKSSWYDCCGIGVSGIVPQGWATPPTGFAGLFIWNATRGVWAPSEYGISSLVLRDGDTIAWANAGFDSQTFELRAPVPTPLDPYPVVGWRADGGNTGAFDSKAPNGATVLWDRDIGVREIVASPAVGYGRVYILTMNGLFALDAETGATRWGNPTVRGFSSPTVSDGSLFVGSRDGNVYRVNATDGSVEWSTPLVSQPGFSGITSSARVVYDWVYIGTFNESGGPGELVSLWASNGSVAWRLPAGGSIHYSTPAFASDRIVVGVMGRYNTTTQITFDPPYGLLVVGRDGTNPWFFETGGPVAASPVVRGTVAYVATRAGGLNGEVHAVDTMARREVWRTPVPPSISSAALHDDTLFLGAGTFSQFGGAYALNASSGEYVWAFDTNGAPVQSSVAYADGKVFFSTNSPNGAIFAVNAATHRLVWLYTPSPADYILGSPVVWNGTVYAPSDNGHVYAIRETGVPLASLQNLGPLRSTGGGRADLGFRVAASSGRITNVSLTVTVPSVLGIEDARPNITRRSGNVLMWDLGTIEFRRPWQADTRVEITITVRVGSVLDSEYNASIPAVLTYSDDAGVPRPPVRDLYVFILVGSLGNPVFWFLGVAIPLIIVAVIAIYFVRRRRKREPS